MQGAPRHPDGGGGGSRVGEEEEERGDRVWRSNVLIILHETQIL